MQARIRSRLSRIDPGLVLAVALSLLAAWAFLLRPSLPRETDAELHVFRAAELGYSLRAGEVYPRWAPDFYYGYGYPIFNYYAPLIYYLANILSFAIPGAAVFGAKAVFVMGFLAAGCGAYGLARRLLGPCAGLIAAASYLFAPYIYLIDPHLRGDLAEFFALGLAPLLFWAFVAYQAHPTRRHFVAASASVAAVILSHNLLGLAFFGMLACYAVWQAVFPVQTPDVGRLRLVVRAALPLTFGVGLAAFFWLPVALESGAVQLANLVGPGHFDFRSHFLTWQELFSPSLPLDLGAVNPAFRFNVGLGQAALGLLGLVLMITRALASRNTQHSHVDSYSLAAPSHLLFWSLSLLTLLFLMTRSSVSVWEAVPIMPFFQFPWRLLGPAALSLAVSAAASVHLLTLLPPRFQKSAYVGLLLLPLLSTLPIWIPPGWDDFGPSDRAAMLDFELNGLALGTTSTGDYVPSTVDAVPGPNADLIASYRAGGPIDRVNRRTLPPGASVELIHQGPTSDEWSVRSDDAFVLRLYRFMFPGWRATVDGKPVSIEIAKPEGFITIPVPEGAHTVRVWLGSTPARNIASAVSLFSLALVMLAAFRLRSSSGDEVFLRLSNVRAPATAVLGFILLALVGAQVRLFQPVSAGLIAAPAEHDLHAYLQGGIDLIGYSLPSRSVRSGELLAVQLYWKAREPVGANYQVFVHLTSIPEHTWGQSDRLNPGDYPTTRWPLDRYVLDPHTLEVAPGTPPGEYTVRVGLWDHRTGIRQLVLDADGAVLGDSIPLPETVTVLPPTRQPVLADFPLDVILDQQIAPGIELLGADIKPGLDFESDAGRLYIILYWRMAEVQAAAVDDEPLVGLRLVAPDGTVAAEQHVPPAEGSFPASDWQPGQVVRDVYSFWLDSSIPAGEYRIEVAWTSGSDLDGDQWLPLTSIRRQQR